ncbi:MAG: hypothetical protein H6R15_762 [Proteobacteria bacterium]|nr:hypothetical protein [Pseudomonadota bacterium]
MLSLAEDALALIAERQQPVFIDLPPTIEACCLEITTCPEVRFGTPRNPDQHAPMRIQGVEIFVPQGFPSTPKLLIRTRKFFGRKRLVLAGWKLV